jgi:phenylalanyl-tRNA synthetase alpha chain
MNELKSSLHRLERLVLPVLANNHTVEAIKKATSLQDVEVIRALQWLANKKLIKLDKAEEKLVTLDANGIKYSTEGLPEVRVLGVLDSPLSLPVIMKKAKVDKQELNISLGSLQKKKLISLKKDKGLIVSRTKQKAVFHENDFLKKKFPIKEDDLSAEEKKIVSMLRKRKDIINVDVIKLFTASLTDLGKKILRSGIDDILLLDAVTPELLRSGEWKGKEFRRFDVEINVPKIHGGKKQQYRAFLDGVRKKFITLGFKEMTGPMVETEFWNMDALFMPQFHAARQIHDGYYIASPKYGVVDPLLIKKVRDAHENGANTGSSGWQYTFDAKRTTRRLLRSQGTACSSRMLASKDLQIPGKYFGITRCFRNDVIDATHLPDFNQVEGIVIEEGLTVRHLFGLLKMFAKEFAHTTEVRLVPGYFPFTEPSVELFAKHPELGWIELGGAGLFRPELVKPLVGKEISVLAWGIGIDRLGMFNLGIKDIRDLFAKNIDVLRNVRMI